MSKIAGTILTIEEYLSPDPQNIIINQSSPETRKISLEENRIYEIPLFQREIRWSADNLNRLISDLKNGPKFLGNIILSICSNRYEIIDGQQRTTVILLIINCIKKLHKTAIEVFNTCKLDNHSFSNLQLLIDNDFNYDNLSETEQKEISSSDIYNQIERYKILWNTLKESKILTNKRKAGELIKNLRKSEVNIIVSQADTEDTSIQYFLDVNLKGVKLDTEDIFKGYLFSKDTSQNIRQLWQSNKQLIHKLNSPNKIDIYPLMKIYEHYFQCELEKNEDYKGIKYGTDFCIDGVFEIDDTFYYKGTHLIEVICDNDFMKNTMQQCQTIIKTIINIVKNTAINEEFKNHFNCDKEIDDHDLQCFFYILRTLLLSKDITPKILTFKYILEFMDAKIHTKKEYKSLYSIFTASIIFIVFSNKKDNNTFTSIVNQNDFINKINEWIYNHINSIELKLGKLIVAYRYSEEIEDSHNQEYLCKSLAAIFNFMRIEKKNKQYELNPTNITDLLEFFRNTEEYSIEHLIIGKNGTLLIEHLNFNYKYPAYVKRYRNSLFNYIFIPSTLNKEIGNKPLYDKISYLDENIEKIKCNFSKKYINELKNKFTDYPKKEMIEDCKDEAKITEILDNYFNNLFPKEFLEFSTELVKCINISVNQ